MALYNVGVFHIAMLYLIEENFVANLINHYSLTCQISFITEEAELEFATVYFAKYNLGGYLPKFTFSTGFL